VSRSADIVVVGGGIAGASVAYHLARRRAGRIVLLEREILCGTGATRASAGGTRKLFSAEVNVRMSVESQALYARFEEELGTPIEPRHTTAADAHSCSPYSCEVCPGVGLRCPRLSIRGQGLADHANRHNLCARLFILTGGPPSPTVQGHGFPEVETAISSHTVFLVRSL
jgi:choline dehydrogenase-like flavoprotein